MVFKLGNQDFVAFFDVFFRPGVGDQVDRFGGVSGKDDFFGFFGVDEFFYPGAGGFIFFRGFFAEGVYAAVDVGVCCTVKIVERADYGFGFLAGGGVVQVDQRSVVDPLG